ncbi:MAG: DUF2087 domain-containing protein [Maritimibacter sp.]
MREKISLTISDMSSFAKALRREAEAGGEAGHQAWMNRIARAAGYRNFQHLSAMRKGAEPVPDENTVTRALRYFDGAGVMTSWPAKTSVQHLCLWAIWAGLPPGDELNEREVSVRIDELSSFGDAAIIRRTMAELGLVTRSRDGRIYKRVERKPGPDARALIAATRGGDSAA